MRNGPVKPPFEGKQDRDIRDRRGVARQFFSPPPMYYMGGTRGSSDQEESQP